MKKRTDLKVALDMSNGESSDVHELENELRSSLCRQHHRSPREISTASTHEQNACPCMLA